MHILLIDRQIVIALPIIGIDNRYHKLASFSLLPRLSEKWESVPQIIKRDDLNILDIKTHIVLFDTYPYASCIFSIHLLYY